jgi:hypothetical protein
LKKLLLFIVFATGFTSFSQTGSFSKDLFRTYDNYKENTLNKRRIKHNDLQPLIEKLRNDKDFEVRILGRSVEGRSISMISIGTGKTNVLLWSQMHGNEPTATMAIFDIFNYLKKNRAVLKNIKLHFIPMLNPDGAERYTRRNALYIDINRDAVRLQSPESKILKNARDSLKADFGFNLHDQSIYYNAERTPKPATISFLAPAYNYEKDINTTRGNAMKIIVQMNKTVQQFAPGQAGRYNDDFEPRAFGDNIQKWGTSTILVESGGYPDDTEKQFIRKLNYVALLAAIRSISDQSYKKNNIKDYTKIPRNDRKLFNLKISNLSFDYLGERYTVDLGINTVEKDNKKHTNFYNIGRIADLGDLSTYYGYKMIDAKDLTFKPGETYPKIVDKNNLEKMNFDQLIKEGYTAIAIDSIPKDTDFTHYPINIVDIRNMAIQKNKMPRPPLWLGANPTFLLYRGNEVVYAIINGFVYDVKNGKSYIKNGVIK